MILSKVIRGAPLLLVLLFPGFICATPVGSGDLEIVIVTLNIEKYVDISIADKNIQMTPTITESEIKYNGVVEVSGYTNISVFNNCGARLSCPSSLILYLNGDSQSSQSYSVLAKVELVASGSGAYSYSNFERWGLDFNIPGSHPDIARLRVTYSKNWSFEDTAGNYWNTIEILIEAI